MSFFGDFFHITKTKHLLEIPSPRDEGDVNNWDVETTEKPWVSRGVTYHSIRCFITTMEGPPVDSVQLPKKSGNWRVDITN